MLSSSTPQRQYLPTHQHQAFKIALFQKPRFDSLWHYHPEIEITWIQKGQGVRHVGNSVQPFRAGDLCVIGPNIPHLYISDPKSTPGCLWTVLQFNPQHWGESFWNLEETIGLKKFLQRSQRPFQLGAPHSASFGEAIKILQKTLYQNPLQIIPFLQLIEAFSHEKRWRFLDTTTHTLSNPRQTLAPLETVFQWIHRSFQSPITQEEASRKAGLSPASFSRTFKKQSGETFQNYVNKVRIANACLQLTSTTEKILTISFDSGFANLSNFNRRFLEVMKMPPKQYRSQFGSR